MRRYDVDAMNGAVASDEASQPSISLDHTSLVLFFIDPFLPVHQTWFEPLSRESYPNMSRLVESFRMSGWEYKFYTDDEAGNFLSTHFPAEVREAYDTLRPGAFKADLFRYCVLLIYGGVYADVDIMLESSLDVAIAPDVGFMVPIDEVSLPLSNQTERLKCFLSKKLISCLFSSHSDSLDPR